MKKQNDTSRRKFIQQTALAGAGLMLARPAELFPKTAKSANMSELIKSKGYAGNDKEGKLVAWNFDRRSVGDYDILIEIKYSGICHSDIHTIKGHWGPQQYPQVEVIQAEEINDAWDKVLNKEARYRYVIDTATI